MSSLPPWARPVPLLVVLWGCGGSSPTPTSPTPATSFLTGTWTGTVAIQVNPGDPAPPPPSSGPMQWTFEVMPQTNLQSFRTTVRSDHPWLTMMTTATTALTPGGSGCRIDPLGPFTSTVLPSTLTVTPLGIAIAFLPIRDIVSFQLPVSSCQFSASSNWKLGTGNRELPITTHYTTLRRRRRSSRHRVPSSRRARW